MYKTEKKCVPAYMQLRSNALLYLAIIYPLNEKVYYFFNLP